MFRNTFQSGFISVLYAVGTHPLQLWKQNAEQDGIIEFYHDEDIASRSIQLRSDNLSTTSITCPPDNSKSLGIRLPILVLLIKNLGEHFSFEVQVLDNKGNRRRFRASNFQSTTRVSSTITTMPLRLETGWNHVQFDLADFVQKVYGTKYEETIRIEVHANCRLRRIFFTDKAYRQEELPAEFKLFLPSKSKDSRNEAAELQRDDSTKEERQNE